MASKFKFSEDAFEMKHSVTKSEKKDTERVVERVVSPAVVNVTEIRYTEHVPSGLSGTRGRKGQKLPTINMRFSEENYEYLKREGAVRGLTRTEFVNWLIESYRSNPAHVHYDDSYKTTVDWS